MSSKYGFPYELLDQAPEKRLDYFRSPGSTIMHRNLEKAFNQLHRIICRPAGASFILLIGPSGVGKTTLLLLIEKKILEASLSRMELDSGWYPIVCVEAPAIKGGFRWKPFYKEILLAVDEPCIEHKIKYVEEGIHRNEEGKLFITTKTTEDSLRLAAEQSLIHRHPFTLAIDEFQHIGISASDEDLKAHMDCAKSVVNKTKVPWTAFGTYDLLDFLELSEQLSRRDRIIHLQRYQWQVDEDMKEFSEVLEYLLCRMPLQRKPKLTKKLLELSYEGCIGNIGTLVDWMAEAYDLCLSENASTLALCHLEETISLESERTKMLEAALEGEAKLTRTNQKRKAFRKKLGIEKDKKQNTAKPEASELQEENISTNNSQQPDLSQQKSSAKASQQKAFTRTPKRDSVEGGAE